MERIEQEIQRTLAASGDGSGLALSEVTAAWPAAVGHEFVAIDNYRMFGLDHLDWDVRLICPYMGHPRLPVMIRHAPHITHHRLDVYERLALVATA